MIRIKKDGEPFDLGDIQMTFRLRSPLWNDIPSHTFSFEMDATDRNMRLSGYLHRPTTYRNQTTDVNVQCDIHGWMLGATLRVQLVTGKKIKCHLAIDNGQLNVDWGNSFLDEMNFPTITRSGGVASIMAFNKDKTSDEVACQFPPIRVPEYFGSNADDALNNSAFINHYDPETGEYDYPTVMSLTGKISVPTVSVPQFYLNWILDQTLLLNGLKVDHRFKLPAILKELLVFSNRCCEEKRRRYYFRAGKGFSQSIYGGETTCSFTDLTTPPNVMEENCYDSGYSRYYIRKYGIHTFYANIVVTSKEGQYAEASIDGQVFTLIVGENPIRHERYYSSSDVGKWLDIKIKCWDQTGSPPTITYKPITIAGSSYFTGRNSSLSTLPKLYSDSYINSKLHLPHIKIKELLAWLKDGFAIATVFNAASQEIRFVVLNDVLKKPASKALGNLDTEVEYSPDLVEGANYEFTINGDDAPAVTDFTGLQNLGSFTTESLLPLPPNSGYYAYVITTGKYYIYTWNDTTSRYEWKPGCDYMKPYSYEPCELEVKPAWHPPAHFTDDWYGTTPWVGCKGSSVHFAVGINAAPFILFNYHGMTRSIHDETEIWLYPSASGLRYDCFGAEIWDMELSWEGEKGLRNLFWLAVEEFYKSRWALKGRRQIDAVWLRQLSWEESYLHKGKEYLLDSVEFTATQLGFTPATITAWRKP